MSRRRPQAADSLELLLDTLCNTFGGVLFIAMLVVVLMQLSGNGATPRPRQPVRAEELHDLTDELEVLDRELAALARLEPAEPEEATPAPPGGDPKDRLSRALERIEEIQRRKDAKLIETGRHDAQALALDEDVAKLDERKKQAESEAEELRLKIEQKKKANARVIHMPVMHRTGKLNLVVELRYDRLYLVHRHDSSGERLGPNLDEYSMLSQSDEEVTVTADPTRGMPITAGPDLASRLRQRLARFPSDRWVLDLVVRGGSFGTFTLLKEAARATGYEMRVLLVGEGSSFQDRGGNREDVQ